MINRLPISSERLSFTLVSVEQKSDFDSGEQKRDRDGVPQWTCTLLVTGDEFRAETCQCTIAAPSAPSIAALTPVQLEYPVAVLWTQGTRAGLAISAKSIRPANARPSAPAPNGSAEPAKSAA